MTIALIYVTCPDREVARSIARTLVDRKVIACANIMDVESLYRYRTEIVNEGEVLLLMKTRAEIAEGVVAAAKDLHPYETPCVVAYASMHADPTYAAWVAFEASRNP